jgi:hypothetical protein
LTDKGRTGRLSSLKEKKGIEEKKKCLTSDYCCDKVIALKMKKVERK